MTKFRSMAQADAKNERMALIVFSIIFGIVYLLFIIPNPWFFHHYFKNAGVFWNVTAIVSCGVQGWFWWKKLRGLSNTTGARIGWAEVAIFFWGAFNIAMLGGFDFTLPT